MGAPGDRAVRGVAAVTGGSGVRSRTVERIHALNLCHYCGICLAACPKDNIRRLAGPRQGFYFHVLDEQACGPCDLCLRICPGEDLDLARLNMSVFGAPPTDERLGVYRRCYLASAAYDDIRHAGASGGVVTALLAFCLEERLVDGALVVADGASSIREPNVYVARSVSELRHAASSRYYPVPIMEGLSQLVRGRGRYAVVGLPCHVHGLRKYEELRKTLSDRVTLRVGLFCGYSTDFASLDFLASRAGLRSFEQVERVNFRAGEWPGHIALRSRDGTEIAMSRGERDLVSMLHMPTRCATCPDQTGELADLSVGDAWLPELLNGADHLWKSVVITRTARGHNAFETAVLRGAIVARNVSADEVARSQENLLVFKKRGMQARIRVLGFFGYGVPNFGARWKLERSRPVDYLGAVAFVIVNGLIVRPAVRRLLERLPSRAIAPFAWAYRNVLQAYDLRRKLVRKAVALGRRLGGGQMPAPPAPPLQP